mgnify:FL=1
MSALPRTRGKIVKPEPPSPTFRLSREILGIILITLGLLVFLSVWSYSASDPSWLDPLSTQHSTNPRITENIVGIVGASIAATLVWLVGAAALAVSILIMLQGIRSFQEETLETKARSLIGSVLMVLCLSALFQFYGSPFAMGMPYPTMGGALSLIHI